MTDPAPPPDGPEVVFESFGVKIALKTDDESIWPALRARIPPHAAPCPGDAPHFRFLTKPFRDLWHCRGMNARGKISIIIEVRDHRASPRHRGDYAKIPGIISACTNSRGWFKWL